jgi:hypothetical protein
MIVVHTQFLQQLFPFLLIFLELLLSAVSVVARISPDSCTLPDRNPLKARLDNCLFLSDLSCLFRLSCLSYVSCLSVLSYRCRRFLLAFAGTIFFLPTGSTETCVAAKAMTTATAANALEFIIFSFLDRSCRLRTMKKPPVIAPGIASNADAALRFSRGFPFRPLVSVSRPAACSDSAVQLLTPSRPYRHAIHRTSPEQGRLAGPATLPRRGSDRANCAATCAAIAEPKTLSTFLVTAVCGPLTEDGKFALGPM